MEEEDYKNKRIFIVDDDVFWTKVLLKQLIALGYHNIQTFEDGQGCMDNLKYDPEVIFLDYQMEGEDGLAILKKIKAHNEHTIVIFCTSQEDLSVALSAIHYGSLDYLLKSNMNAKELKRLFAKFE